MCMNNSRQEGYKTGVLEQAVTVFHEVPWHHSQEQGHSPAPRDHGNFHAKHQQEDVAHLYHCSTLKENGSPRGTLRNNAKQASLPQSRSVTAAPVSSEPSALDAPLPHAPTSYPTMEEPGTATSSLSLPGSRCSHFHNQQLEEASATGLWRGCLSPAPAANAITWVASAEPFHSA